MVSVGGGRGVLDALIGRGHGRRQGIGGWPPGGCALPLMVMDWDSPTTKKHIAEAKAQGCELVGAAEKVAERIFRLPCGHQQVIATSHMRDANF